jgi:S-methylmethionine-dependent homocysteine/selenocysteine methylase
MQLHPVFERLTRGQPIVLDGDTTHALTRRGYRPTSALGTAAAAREVPQVLSAVHREFVAAGADVVLAFTAQTSVRVLARAGFGMRSAALTNHAVDLALEAAQSAGRPVAVAGVLGPLGVATHDPAHAPSLAMLADEHFEQATRLEVAGCDAIVVGPMTTLAEAVAATAAARRVTRAVWVALDAESATVADAARLVVAAGAQVV